MKISLFQDEYFMEAALKLAHQASEEDEVPVGAVIVHKNRIIGKGYNQVEKLNDATAHAEMIAITAACAYSGSKYLNDCSLFVTLEPCVMCAGAVHWIKLKRLVFGARDGKAGFYSSDKNPLSPSVRIQGGLLEEKCAILLKSFFGKKRATEL